MTDKQENILEAALKLFASEGYASTPTSKIAKEAGVSEGLIFRHFTNKQGLLDAIMLMAETKLGELYGPVFMETNPKMVIQKTFEVMLQIDEKDFDFWKLQFMLKWQDEYNNPEKMKPVIDKLSGAFKELGYGEPEFEAEQLNILLEGLSMNVLKGNWSMQDTEDFFSFLKRKYEL